MGLISRKRLQSGAGPVSVDSDAPHSHKQGGRCLGPSLWQPGCSACSVSFSQGQTIPIASVGEPSFICCE